MQPIIIIEEETHYLRELEELMLGSRNRVIGTSSYKKGFDYAKSVPPRLIIMGFNPLNKESIDTLSLIKKESITKHAPILGILRESIPKYNENLLQVGVTSLLYKPLKKEKFLETIHDLIEKYEKNKTTAINNSKSHVIIKDDMDSKIILEFRSGLKNFVLPEIRQILNHEFIKSVLNKHICIDIRLLPEMSEEEIKIFDKILKAFGEKRVSILTGTHMGNLIRHSDASDDANLFLSIDDYNVFLENPDLDE
jgi:DNA-binding NarL/FixJ family response regulator